MNARVLLAATVALAAAVAPLRAQRQDPEQMDRLSAATRARIGSIVDSARAMGLPTEKLLDLAREGASKRASGAPVADAAIVDAVHRMFAQLGVSRAALGANARTGEIESGATALKYGADRRSIERLRALRPAGSLEVQLGVLAYLGELRMPAPEAVRVVTQLAEHRLSDAEFLRFKTDVDSDIKAGRPLIMSATLRANALAAEALIRDANTGPRNNTPPPQD